MSNPIKITCIIHGLGLGGMERVMASLLNSFSNKENVEVSLLMIGRYRTIEFDIPDAVNVYIPEFEFNSQLRSLSTLKTIRFIRKKVKEINPDTILSFGEYWNNLVLLSLIGLKFPIYISDRSQPNKDLGNVQNVLRKLLYPKATGYIAQTKKAAEIAFKNKWNKNIKVIGNPIRVVQDHSDIAKENIVLTVGRLIKTKNIDALITIFSSIDMPEWKLVIVGGNAKNMSLLDTFQTRVNNMKMQDRIKLVGAQKNVDEYYRKSKIFAFTSSSEGFPNVVGEALSAGLPVVSYDCVAGPSDMIEDGKNGYLIPLFDEEKFKTKLKILMQDKSKRDAFGKNSKKIITKFAVDKVSEKFYRFILNN